MVAYFKDCHLTMRDTIFKCRSLYSKKKSKKKREMSERKNQRKA